MNNKLFAQITSLEQDSTILFFSVNATKQSQKNPTQKNNIDLNNRGSVSASVKVGKWQISAMYEYFKQGLRALL